MLIDESFAPRLPFNLFPGNGEVGWILVEKISLCPQAVLNEVRVPTDLSKIKVEFFLVFSAQEREKLVAVGIVPLRERGGGREREGERERRERERERGREGGRGRERVYYWY